MVASQRLAAIDIIRGYCVFSMVSSHLAAGTLFARVMHVFPEFDGASGFVLLSGLVLGMVQGRRVIGPGLVAAEIKTLHRVIVITIAQVVLILIGIVVAWLTVIEHRNVPPIGNLDAGEIVWNVVTLNLAPPSGSVLRLYVLLLLLAMVAYWLLSRGRWLVVLLSSAALYAIGYLFPRFTSFSGMDGVTPGANWANWQLLFVSALVLGWHWRTLRIAERLDRRRLVVAGCAVSIILASFFAGRMMPSLFDKLMFAPGLLLNAYAVVGLLYVLLSVALRYVPRSLFRPLEMIGTRSLDSYIIQAGVAIIVPSILLFRSDSILGLIIALLALCACWAWAEYRRSRHWPATIARRRSLPSEPIPVGSK